MWLAAGPADGTAPLLESSGGLLQMSAGAVGAEAGTHLAGTALGLVGCGSSPLPPQVAAGPANGTVDTAGGTGLAGSAVELSSGSGLMPGCLAGARA